MSASDAAADARLIMPSLGEPGEHLNVLDIPLITPPNKFYPERVLFVVDNSHEMGLKLSSTKPLLRCDYVRQCIEAFCHQKSRLSAQHQFAVASFDKTPTLICPFTRDPEEIKKSLRSIRTSNLPPSGPFDLTSILQLCSTFVDPTGASGLRLILVYGRVSHIPTLNTHDASYAKLAHPSSRFTADAVYIFEKRATNAQPTYDKILLMGPNPAQSYFFDGASQPKRISGAFLSMLAHPAQRPLHADCQFNAPIVTPARPIDAAK